MNKSECLLVEIRKLSDELDKQDNLRFLNKEREIFLLLNAITDMVIVIRNGIIKYANPSSYRVLGYDPNELMNLNINEIISEQVIKDNLDKTIDINIISKDKCSIRGQVYIGRFQDLGNDFYVLVIQKAEPCPSITNGTS